MRPLCRSCEKHLYSSAYRRIREFGEFHCQMGARCSDPLHVLCSFYTPTSGHAVQEAAYANVGWIFA